MAFITTPGITALSLEGSPVENEELFCTGADIRLTRFAVNCYTW